MSVAKEIYESTDKFVIKYLFIINEDGTSKLTEYFPNGTVKEFKPMLVTAGKGMRIEYAEETWKIKSSLPFMEYTTGTLDERYWNKIK